MSEKSIAFQTAYEMAVGCATKVTYTFPKLYISDSLASAFTSASLFAFHSSLFTFHTSPYLMGLKPHFTISVVPTALGSMICNHRSFYDYKSAKLSGLFRLLSLVCLFFAQPQPQPSPLSLSNQITFHSLCFDYAQHIAFHSSCFDYL